MANLFIPNAIELNKYSYRNLSIYSFENENQFLRIILNKILFEYKWT